MLILAAHSVIGQAHQPPDSTFFIAAAQMHLGRALPHSRTIADLTDAWLWGVQADVSRIRLTQKAWSTCNCYSQNGVSLSYFNFNNRDELGSGLSLAVFLEPQLIYGQMNVALRAGAGISYLTRVYHPDNNPRNLFFSAPWSGLLLLQLSGRYRLYDQWILSAGVSYHHISNGGQRQPNKGMNFPTIDVGIAYAANYQMFRRPKLMLIDRTLKYYGSMAYNTRRVEQSDYRSESREAVIGVQGGFYKPVARMHGVGLAMEFIHDRALKKQSQNAAERFDHNVLSALVRHHFLFGKFDFSQTLGIYLHKEYATPENVFQRYAIEYVMLKHLRVGFSLKAHLYTAEQMDIRVGVMF